MDFPLELLINAIIAGMLLGGFYVAVTVGISISFGMLDIVNIAHPAFIILGSYLAYIVNSHFGIDPILVGLLMLPVFYALGAAVYQVYYLSFEKRGQEALRGLAFFFGILFITEVGLILVFGVDYRYVEAAYIGPTLALCLRRPALPHAGARACSRWCMLVALQLYLSRTFIGRAIKAVSQDQRRARPDGGEPDRASSASRSASRSRPPRWPARSSSSSSRSSLRSGANISGACSRSACSAGSAACPAR